MARSNNINKMRGITGTQYDNVLRHLLLFGPVTPLEALHNYGCFRLAAIVCDLRKAGWDIKTDNITIRTQYSMGQTTFAKYSIDVESKVNKPMVKQWMKQYKGRKDGDQ